MEPVLKTFSSVSVLLRTFFAGAFFFISYQVAAGEVHGLDIGVSKDSVEVAIFVALLAGQTINALFRSWLYPVVECVFELDWARNCRKRFPLISDRTIDELSDIWGMGMKEEDRSREHAARLSIWADFTHFNYLSALCIAAGSSARVFLVPGNYPFYQPLCILAVVLGLGGLISDWRLKRAREKLRVPRLVLPTVYRTRR